jgi:alanyl aminopeptidase
MRDGARAPWYVYSQFEPTDARRAFPCFDEPQFKVPWQFTLHVKRTDLAASNTPVTSETAEDGEMKRVQFAATRPLPSYLIALAVGPFEIVNIGKTGRKKTPLRILAPAGHRGETQFAEAAIPELLNLLENYFDSPFPYEKLDSVVMPVSDFAMENAGLITYNLADLLSRPDRDTSARQRACAVTVAHEMAHQWFGDLVTPAWWDDIWLNEAFATWLEKQNYWRVETEMEDVCHGRGESPARDESRQLGFGATGPRASER